MISYGMFLDNLVTNPMQAMKMSFAKTFPKRHEAYHSHHLNHQVEHPTRTLKTLRATMIHEQKRPEKRVSMCLI